VVQFIERDEFLDDRLDIRPGEHVNIISPTGGGKSHLAYQCLERTLARYPYLRHCSFCLKGQDSTTAQWGQHLGLKEISDWPPPHRWPWQEIPAGYVLWPNQIRDDETANRAHMAEVCSRALNDQYWSGDSISFVDDSYIAAALLHMSPELDRHWIAGRSSRAGLWTALQKPSGTMQGGVSSFAYDSPTHLFLGRDNDKRNLQRLSEISISQIDPRQIADIVTNLAVRNINDSAVSEMLYLDRRGPYMAVVGI
jgi:hypothetical protein